MTAEGPRVRNEPAATLRQRQAEEQTAYRAAITAAKEGRWADAARNFEVASAACEGVPELTPERARAAFGFATAAAAQGNNEEASTALRKYAAIAVKEAAEIKRRFPDATEPADALRVWAQNDLPQIDVSAALSKALNDSHWRAMDSYLASARSVVGAIAQYEAASARANPFLSDSEVTEVFEKLTNSESEAVRAYQRFSKMGAPESVSRSLEPVDRLYSVFMKYRAGERQRGRLARDMRSDEERAKFDAMRMQGKALHREWVAILPEAHNSIEVAEAEWQRSRSERVEHQVSIAPTPTPSTAATGIVGLQSEPVSNIEARVESYASTLSSANAERVSLLYAEMVERYFGDNPVDRAYVLADKTRFFRAWPRARYRIMEVLSTSKDSDGRQTAKFTMAFDVEGSKRRTGVVEEHVIWNADGLIVSDVQRVLAK